MGSEQWPQQPLNNAEAQEEANMMRAKLEANPERTGQVMETGEKITAEDYDKALEVVEEMKRMAEEEPASKKVMYEMARLATKSKYGIRIGLTYLSTLPDAFWATAGLKDERKEALGKLDDAASELRKLKAEAEKFEDIKVDEN